MIETVIKYLAQILAVLFVLIPHEVAHGWVAYKNGDPTAKIMGRLTLNPKKHLDLLGFIMCALVGFGWAKPVPINPNNFKNYRKGLFTTAIAGVVTNYIIAFFAYLLYVLFVKFVFVKYIETIVASTILYYVVYFIYIFLYMTYQISLCLVVFNLLPLYPLDGFRVVESFTREVNKVRRFLRDYGQMILIILVVESFLCERVAEYAPWVANFNVLDYLLGFATNIIGYPIKLCWGWIVNL